MMPMQPMQGGPAGPMGPNPGVGVGPKPEGGMNDQGSPDDIKAQLKMLLMKAKEIASQNGIDFSEVIAEVEGNRSKSDIPLPRPPGP